MPKHILMLLRKSVQRCLLLLVLLGTSLNQLAVTHAEDPKPVPKWQLTGPANQLIQNHRSKFRIPGISVAIAERGKVVYFL